MNDKRTILIVDDDEDFRAQTRMMLEASGYKVIEAEGADQAEEILGNTRPDLAVVDLMMEHVDGGFALCYHIKKLDESIPVVLVTGVARETGMDFDAATEEERSWVKADAFLAKPVRAEQLQREIRRLLTE